MGRRLDRRHYSIHDKYMWRSNSKGSSLNNERVVGNARRDVRKHLTRPLELALGTLIELNAHMGHELSVGFLLADRCVMPSWDKIEDIAREIVTMASI